MAKDIFHNHVKQILINEGWTITHDPYRIEEKGVKIYEIDLGAERLIAAEKDSEKIAIEIKSFTNDSTINDFHGALGQYINYKVGLDMLDSDRVLYLAMPLKAYNQLWKLALIRKSIETYDIKLLVYTLKEEKFELWRK